MGHPDEFPPFLSQKLLTTAIFVRTCDLYSTKLASELISRNLLLLRLFMTVNFYGKLKYEPVKFVTNHHHYLDANDTLMRGTACHSLYTYVLSLEKYINILTYKMYWHILTTVVAYLQYYIASNNTLHRSVENLAFCILHARIVGTTRPYHKGNINHLI